MKEISFTTDEFFLGTTLQYQAEDRYNADLDLHESEHDIDLKLDCFVHRDVAAMIFDTFEEIGGYSAETLFTITFFDKDNIRQGIGNVEVSFKGDVYLTEFQYVRSLGLLKENKYMNITIVIETSETNVLQIFQALRSKRYLDCAKYQITLEISEGKSKDNQIEFY